MDLQINGKKPKRANLRSFHCSNELYFLFKKYIPDYLCNKSVSSQNGIDNALIKMINTGITGLLMNLSQGNELNGLHLPVVISSNNQLSSFFTEELCERLKIPPSDLSILWENLYKELLILAKENKNFFWGTIYYKKEVNAIFLLANKRS